MVVNMQWDVTSKWAGILDKCGKCGSDIYVHGSTSLFGRKIYIKCRNPKCGQTKSIIGDNAKVMTKWNKTQRKYCK